MCNIVRYMFQKFTKLILKIDNFKLRYRYTLFHKIYYHTHLIPTVR